MNDSEIEKYFSEQKLESDEKTLEELNSDSEVIGFVKDEIGGIGFISSKSLTPDIRARIKVVLSSEEGICLSLAEGKGS